MTTERWQRLSAWHNTWLAADAGERERLRTELAATDPALSAEAEELAAMSAALPGFLETPAFVLAAPELAKEEPLLSTDAMLGPYRVVGLIARGGMGDVYRATDVRLRRDVAVKVLAPDQVGDARRVDRFLKEARITAALDHPNIVRLYDVGAVDGFPYLVAELLDGETLRARLERGALPAEEALRIGAEAAGALVAAHAAGLVHRDLKPENIFLTRTGTTKILDFGIAKLAESRPRARGSRPSPGSCWGPPGTSRRSRSGAARSMRGRTCSRVDPRWDELRGSPSFRAVMSRVNLLEVSNRTCQAAGGC